MEYLKAWCFAEKARQKRGMRTAADENLMRSIDKTVAEYEEMKKEIAFYKKECPGIKYEQKS